MQLSDGKDLQKRARPTDRDQLATFLIRAGFLGAADKLDAGEDVDAAGQQHGEALDAHAALAARLAGRAVPVVEVHALRLVVDVVEEAVLGHEQRVALERSGCARERQRRKKRGRKGGKGEQRAGRLEISSLTSD